jgi:hypothetical protein
MTSAIETAVANDYKLVGSTVIFGTASVVSDDTQFSTVGTASVQGRAITTNAGDKILVKAGTASATVTVTVLDDEGAPVGANRPVVTTLSTRTAAVKVNALTAGQSNLVTDANGQVSLVVTSSSAIDGDAVTISAVAEGVAGSVSNVVVEWDTLAYKLYDLSTTVDELVTDERTMALGSSYDLSLFVADQWYQAAPSDTYRVKVSGSGVTEGFNALTAGKTSVTVTDVLSAEFDSVLTVQKATAGVFADTATVVTITNKVLATTSAKITMAADGSAVYAGETSDLSNAVALKALVERDNRVAFVDQPVYTNSVLVTGKVANKSTGASLTGAVVSLSGSSSILFSDGDVDNRGSITVVADDSGEFSVLLYSTTAMTDSVITVASMGVTSTAKVSFVGAGIGEGTSLVVTMPAAVQPASTFQVKAKLADAYGNGVNTGATAIKVTYTGAGIVFGTLPTTTDANGELMFSVLLGSNDTGTISVTVSYDQNADSDYLDAKDLVSVGTTAITASGEVASASKVNVGSFKGYVALYAKGYEGQKMSAIVAGKWIVVASLASDFERVVRFTGAGYTITTKIYIDGVQIGSEFTTVTK